MMLRLVCDAEVMWACIRKMTCCLIGLKQLMWAYFSLSLILDLILAYSDIFV